MSQQSYVLIKRYSRPVEGKSTDILVDRWPSLVDAEVYRQMVMALEQGAPYRYLIQRD